MTDHTVIEIVQPFAQVVLWVGIGAAAIVAARVALILVRGVARADREEALGSTIWTGLAVAPLIVFPLIINAVTPVEGQGDAPPTNPSDTAPMDWTPWLWALGAVLGALAIVGLVVVSVKAGRKVRKRRTSRKAAAAEQAGTQDQEQEHWRSAVHRHDALRAEFYALENDPMARLTMPAFWDFTRPLSVAWWDAQGAADNRRTEKMPADSGWRHDYVDAVDRAARAFAAARDGARRIGLSTMGEDERRRVRRAQKALATVLDDASTEAERRIAYRIVLDNIAGVVDLPPVMRHQLTARTGRELTSTDHADR